MLILFPFQLPAGKYKSLPTITKSFWGEALNLTVSAIGEGRGGVFCFVACSAKMLQLYDDFHNQNNLFLLIKMILPTFPVCAVPLFSSIPFVTLYFEWSTVWGEASSEARAPGEQPEQRGCWGWGGRWWRRLRLRRRILSQSALLWLHQAGPLLCDRDGTVRPAAQASPHCNQELPSCQSQVNNTRGAVPEEGRILTLALGWLNASYSSAHTDTLNCL